MSSSYLSRFEQIGYRRNPFGSLTPDEWEVIALPHPDLLPYIDDSTVHLQVIGEKGRGKTSALRAVQFASEEAGLKTVFERLPIGKHHFYSSLMGVDVFLLDEAQRLYPWEILRLIKNIRRHQVRLVVGNHIDYSVILRGVGMKLRTVRLTDFDVDYIARIAILHIRNR